MPDEPAVPCTAVLATLRGAARGGPLRAVSLDALGTLLELEPLAPRLQRELERRFGRRLDAERVARAAAAEIAFYRAHHLVARDRPSLEKLREDCARVVLDALPELCRGSVPAQRRVATVREALLAAISFRLAPDAVATVRALRTLGLRVGVTSNWDCDLQRVLGELGLCELVDVVVASAAVGVAKPDRRLFAVALERLGVKPGEALHVGDDPLADLAGARLAGLSALLLDRGGRYPECLAAIGALAQLPPLLSGI